MSGTRIRYTPEEKEAALRLCEEIGVTKTSKETGISVNTLYKWRFGVEDEIATLTTNEAPAEEALIEEKGISLTRKRYTSEEREKALRLCKEIGVNKASKKTGITANTLYKWRSGARDGLDTIASAVYEASAEDEISEEKEPYEDISADDTAASSVVEAVEELIRLRIENTSLKVQITTLKNALRVFTEVKVV